MAVFSEAAAISEDPRLPRAAAHLLDGARTRWSSREPAAVDEVMRSAEACLLCVNLPEARELAAEAVDALERVVAGAYRPGQGVSHETGRATFVRGSLSDHVSVGVGAADRLQSDRAAALCDACRRADAVGPAGASEGT